MKSILYISQDFPPDPVANAYRVFETSRLLKKRGFKVHVLTARPFRSKKTPQPLNFVTRVPIWPSRGGSVLNFLLHYGSFFLATLAIGLLGIRKKFDVILVASPPLPAAMSAWMLAKIKKAKLIADIHDLWPDSPADLNIISRGGLVFKIGKSLEKFIYNHADAITCTSRPAAQIIKASQSAPAPVFVSYCGPDQSIIPPLKNPPLLPSARLPLKIAYFGNFGTVHRLDLLIKAVKKLETLPLELHFYGSGLKEPNLKKLTQKLHLENKIIFHGVVSREKSLILMQNCHILATGSALPYANSSKIFDYLTANRPILGNVAGEGAQILKAASPANEITAPNSSLGLAKGIKIMYKEYPRRLKAARKHRQLALRKYTRQKATEKLIKYLKKL